VYQSFPKSLAALPAGAQATTCPRNILPVYLQTRVHLQFVIIFKFKLCRFLPTLVSHTYSHLCHLLHTSPPPCETCRMHMHTVLSAVSPFLVMIRRTQCVTVCCVHPCRFCGRCGRGFRERGCVMGVLQCVAVCCSVLQCVAVRCSVLHCVAVCCSVLQCGAVCCNVLHCVTVWCRVL